MSVTDNCKLCGQPWLGHGQLCRNDRTSTTARRSEECCAPLAGSGKVVVVPLTWQEARDVLFEALQRLPDPLPHNFEHGQYDLMLQNLEALERQIWKAKRVAAALSPNGRTELPIPANGGNE